MLLWVKLRDEKVTSKYAKFKVKGITLQFGPKHSGALLGSNSVRNKAEKDDKYVRGRATVC